MSFRTLFVMFAGLLLLAGASEGSTILLADETGTPLGRLFYLERGEEQLIPANLLARKAQWSLERTPEGSVIRAPGCEVLIRRDNPFVRVNDTHVQLRVNPEEWDGSVWLPISGLEALFPTSLEHDEAGGVLKVRMGEPEPEVTPETAPTETGAKPSGGWELGTVIIDPGHGGKDTGARGLNGLLEKDVTLDIAKRAAAVLRRQGVDTRLTREDDRFLPLKARTEFANSNGGDLFVSIHANSFHDPLIGGLECYFLSPARTDRAIAAAEKENSVVQLETQDHGYQDLTEENHILLTMATAQYMQDSERWAGVTLDQAAGSTGLHVRGVDQAGFYVLMGASMPAILFECGFITNANDARIMGTERGRQRLGESVAESVLAMKRTMEAAAQSTTTAERN